MSPKSDSPKAKSWDKLSAQKTDETNAYRDVYEDQQLDRSQIEKKSSKTSRTVISVVVGTLVTIVAWVFLSLGHWVLSEIGSSMGSDSSEQQQGPAYYTEWREQPWQDHCFWPVDEDGQRISDATCYETEAAAQENPPQWYLEYVDSLEEPAEQEPEEPAAGPQGPVEHLGAFFWWKLIVSALAGLLVFSIMYPFMMRNLAAQNLMRDTKDINQYKGDQHIALPDELMRKFSWFPDVGAHSSVQPSSMISHVMITNKGLKKVELSQRAESDIFDEDGDVEYYKGAILRDDNGAAKTSTVPIIDEKFGDALFDASGLPKDKSIRKKYETTAIPYNPGGKDREKTGKHKTVAELINEDWVFPEFETQRPGGAYLVDESPVNTMVLAITRAGKGQTYIEPMIDMWLREKNPNNMVINDPKGELLVDHYVRATIRGYQVVQFNLINPAKTDIYNPLGMAAESAREGDTTKVAMYVENIADVFFPTDGGEDPVWPNAANNAFKRAAYGLIDYYLEEERELRAYALRTDMDPKVLNTMLDERWGKVTLYNCYQLFVQLTAKKVKNPMKKVQDQLKANEFGTDDDFDQEAYDEALEEAQRTEFMWEDAPELDQLTLFFNATQGLPTNNMRTLVANADNALRAMGAAEKMLASVYGIAITAMSFFTDPTISTLTSGRPSQNVDLGGMSFPRRMGVRFAQNYLERDYLIGSQARWEAYADPMFTQRLEGDFEHEDIVSREGWARYYFKGVFPQERAYLKLRLINPQSGMLLRTFYFRFTKDYQTSLDGRRYTTDPITGSKLVKDGTLVELKRFDAEGAQLKATDPEEKVAEYLPAHTTFPQMRLVNLTLAQPEKEMGESIAIISNTVRYSESPKAVFLVTPPHLMKYAKLILILVKQLVDLNFDQSYMTKSNQKPLYKTRFMLDELGNLQSDGQGISGFETMLSIGLGQEQQFTIILQTLQQLREVYGESTDKIVQGNVSNIIFLKSTDDSMIETLEKMSGKTHVAYMDSKTVTKDASQVLQFSNVEGKVSYTMNTKEEPVIKYNDMAFISPRNSIVFRAGDPPAWNRNETILPMSFRLFKDTIIHPGHEYSLQTLPTLSSALDFDVRKNQPDFEAMLAKRMEQAEKAIACVQIYRDIYEYEDIDIARLDRDVYSNEIMELVDSSMRETQAVRQGRGVSAADEVNPDEVEYEMMMGMDMEADVDIQRAVAAEKQKKADRTEMRYAEQQISREMLVRNDGRGMTGSLDAEFIEVFKAIRAQMGQDTEHFRISGNGSLCSADGSKVYITKVDESESMAQIKESSESEESRVYAESEEDIAALGSFVVQPQFYEFLASLQSWRGLADGEFDKQISRQMRASQSMDMAA